MQFGDGMSRLLLAVVLVSLTVAVAEPAMISPVSGPAGPGSPRPPGGSPLQSQANASAPIGVASTLVLANNTLVPGNFLAANGGGPLRGCVDTVRHLVFALSWGVLNAINESSDSVVGGVSLGTNDRGIACAPSRSEVFVADAQANLLYVVDTVTMTVVADIAVGQQPQAVAYDSGTGEIYVGNSVSNDVTVVAATNRTVVDTIPVGSPVWGLVYDPAKGEVFVSLGPGNSVSVLSDATHAVVASVNVGYFPQGLAYDPTDGEILVANEQSNNVSVISDATNQVVAGIPAGTRPVAVAYDPVSRDILVANSYSGDVTLLSAVSHAVLATIGVGGGAGGGPYDVQVDPGTGLAFVDGTSTANVIVVDIGTRSIAAEIPTGASPFTIASDPVRGELFVGSGAQGTINVLSDTTNRIIASIPVGIYPRALAVDPNRGLVFAPALTQGTNTMYVISAETNALTATFSFTAYPSAVAVDPDRGLIFLADAGSPPSIPGEILVYNETTFAEVAHMTVGTSPQTLAYDAGTGQMFIGSQDGAGNGVVYVVNDSTLSLVANVTVAPGPNPWLTSLAYDPELGEIWVADNWANAIHVVSDVSDTVVANVTGLPGPKGLAYVGSGLVVVTGNGTFGSPPGTPGFVSVVSDAANAVLTTVSVGASPVAAVYDPNVAAVYVANEAQGTISIVPIPRPYEVTFTESGLAAGAPWSVVLNGRTAWTTKPRIAFLEPNGTYGYEVAPRSGYTATPATGNASVSGAAVAVTVVFSTGGSPPPPPPPPPSPTPNGASPAAFDWLLAVLVAFASAVVVSVGLTSAWDESTRFLVLGTIAIPFFSLRKEQALDHFVRGQIFEYVRNHPGATYTEIKDQLSLNNGSAAHHLMVLEKMGFLVSRREGRTKRFFRIGTSTQAVPSLLSPLQYNILSLLAQEPLPQRDLAHRLDSSKQRVSYNVRRLRRDGYLELAQDGRVLHVTGKGTATLAQHDSAAGQA